MRRLVAIAGAVLLVGALAMIYVSNRGPGRPGPEFEQLGGFYESGGKYNVGDVFSDGLTYIPVLPGAAEPIRIISITPVGPRNEATRPLGILVRLLACPPDCDRADGGGFTTADGFLPEGYRPESFMLPADLVIPPPEPGQELAIHVIQGHVAIAEGQTTRDGLEIIYEYGGDVRRLVEPSRLVICVPFRTNVDCERPEP